MIQELEEEEEDLNEYYDEEQGEDNDVPHAEYVDDLDDDEFFMEAYYSNMYDEDVMQNRTADKIKYNFK